MRQTGITEKVSAWRNNEGTTTKQSKISLTFLFITCPFSDSHTNCCCVSSVSSVTLQHPSCPKWFITLEMLQIWLSVSTLPEHLKHHTFVSWSHHCWGPPPPSFLPSHLRCLPQIIFQPIQIQTYCSAALCHSQTPTWRISGNERKPCLNSG